MALYEAGGKLFVADTTNDRILVFDTSTLGRDEISMTEQGGVVWLAVHEGTGTLYADTILGGTVVIDADTLAVGSAIPDLGGSATPVVDQERGRLYTFGGGVLSAVDVGTNSVVGEIDVSDLMAFGIIDLDRGGLNPLTGELVFTNRHEQEFAIVDGPSMTGEGDQR